MAGASGADAGNTETGGGYEVQDKKEIREYPNRSAGRVAVLI
jgi:hypothetical protein